MRNTTGLERNWVPDPDLLGGGSSWDEQQSWRPVWGTGSLAPSCKGWKLLGVGTSLLSQEYFRGGC